MSSSFSTTTSPWLKGILLGRGSFSAVHLAISKSSNSIFAVKSVPTTPSSFTQLKSLENEIEILKSISSPFVVSYLGDDLTVDASSGGPHRNLHLEYMPGGTLTDVVVRSSPELDEMRCYARCVAEGLKDLHAVGIVHGDVKGRNVLVGSRAGFAKLADFGSSRRIRDPTRLGFVSGTPLWMAPEVMRGAPPTPVSDVWSFGCTVIEMVTGKAPWKESDLVKILAGNMPGLPEGLSELGRDFVEKCLRWDPEERWSCEELLGHEFLVGPAPVDRWSPRSVMDWTGFEDDSASSVGGGSWEAEIGICPNEARKKIAELAAEPSVDWDDDWDGWEVVRGGVPIGDASDRCQFDLLNLSSDLNLDSDLSPDFSWDSGSGVSCNLVLVSTYGSCDYQKSGVKQSGKECEQLMLWLLLFLVVMVYTYPHFILSNLIGADWSQYVRFYPLFCVPT